MIEQTSSKEFLNQISIIIEETVKRLFPNTKENDSDEEFLTINQTAKLLQVCKTSVYNYTKKGQLKAHHIGNTTRYSKNEVLKIMKSGFKKN